MMRRVAAAQGCARHASLFALWCAPIGSAHRASLRQGPEIARLNGFKLKQHGIDFTVYGLADYSPDAPRPPVAWTRASRLQMEPGIFRIGAQPFPKCHAPPLVRIGSGIAVQVIRPAGTSISARRFWLRN
jgi:hypothetical protein